MYLFTISLLLFSNLLIEISTSEVPSSTLKPATRKVNYDHDNCVCFPGGQSLIPEVTNRQGNGLERLVVYLYRDPNSNQIKAFIPSPEKQTVIPNIPYTIGDAYKTVTTDTVASLFQPHHQKIGRDHPLTDSTPIALKWGTIEQAPLSPSHVNILQGYPQIHTQPVQQQDIYTKNIPVSGNLVYPDHHNPLYHTQPQYEVFTGDPNMVQNINNQVPSNPFQNNSPVGPNQIKLAQVTVNPPGSMKHDIFAPGNINPGHTTFDQWFTKQMDTFRDVNTPEDILAINTDLLRSSIQKALFDNHMHIGSSGQLTDANGTPIDINLLELRPILIGDSVKYPQVNGEQLALPKHLPYLEGILITLVYPPKVLGIIPLGKTYVSQRALEENLATAKPHIYYTGSESGAKLEPQPSIANPILGVTASPTSFQSHMSPVPSTQPVIQSSLTNHQYPYSQLLHPNGGLPPGNIHQTSQISSPSNAKLNTPYLPYTNLNNPSMLGSIIPSSPTVPNLPNHDILWGPQHHNHWERRSPKPVKPRQKLRRPKTTTVPPDTNKVSKKSKPRPRSFDSNSGNRELSFSANYPNQNSLSHSNLEDHLLVIPINSNLNSYMDPYAHNTYSQSNPNEGTQYYNLISGPFSGQNEDNILSNLVAYPAAEPADSGSGWNPYSLAAQVLNPNSFINTQGPLQSNIINVPASHTALIPSLNPEWGSLAGFGSPSYTAKSGSWPSSNTVEHKSGQVLPVATADSLYPFGLNSYQQDKKPIGGNTRRYSMSSVQSVLKSLVNMLLQNLSHGDQGKGIKAKTNRTSSNPLNKNGENDEGPDFRIIGGSAATGSGSPLSNKGRSGRIIR